MLCLPPAAQGHQSPDGLHEAERPRALEETVNRAKRAGEGEGKYEPGAATFQRVGNEHGGNSEQSVKRERTHRLAPSGYASGTGAR